MKGSFELLQGNMVYVALMVFGVGSKASGALNDS